MAFDQAKDSLILQGRLVRRSIRRIRQAARYRRLALAGIPVLFANSFPKSGTHLLTQVLDGFTRLGPAVISGLPAIATYEGDTGRELPVREILHNLRRLLPGDIAYGHLHARPQILEYFQGKQFAAYFILRDPRDVVVSHAHYVTDMETEHVLHRYYQEELHTFDERLAASILGRPDFGFSFPDIGSRFAPYLGWLSQPDTLVLHYEDFILAQEATLGCVLDHAVRNGFPLNQVRPAAILTLQASIDPPRSPTFRSGKVGGWRAEFSEANKLLFKQVAGDLLIRLGYEQDTAW